MGRHLLSQAGFGLYEAEKDEKDDQGYGKPPGGEEDNQRGKDTQQEEQ